MSKKIFISVVLALLLCSNSFAQKFGVDLGYAYSFNSLKYYKYYDLYIQQLETRYKDVSMNQMIAPNVFVRPYLKLYKPFYLFAGADLLRFKFRCTENVYSTGEGWVPQLYKINELHIPVGLKYKFGESMNKQRINIYVGMFGRYFIWSQQWINRVNTEPDFSGKPDGANPGFVYRKKFQAWANFMVGGQYQFKAKNWLSFNADLYLKYISSGTRVFQPNGMMSGFPAYTNKFSFHIAVGCSFMKPDKQKTEGKDPGRLDD